MRRSIALSLTLVLLLTCLAVCPFVLSARNARGDVNGDDSIDMKDVLAIRKSMAGMNPSPFDGDAADANGDGSVDMKDVLLVRKHLASMPVSFAPYSDATSTVSTTSTTSSTTSVPSGNDSQLTPDQIALNYYDSQGVNVACTWHTEKNSSSQVLQYVESASPTTDFSSGTEIAAKMTAYKTDTMPYDLATNTFTFGSTEKVNDYCYQVAMTGLKPGTTYAYRVGDKAANIWSTVETFTTQPANCTKFSFINVTDTQSAAAAATDVDKYMRNALTGALEVDPNASFIFHGGDIVQRSGWLHQWRVVFNGNAQFLRKLPVVPITGNHDSTYDSAGEYEIVKHFYLDYPPSNNATDLGVYYSFDYGNAHFVVINTDNFRKSDGALDEAQYQWLEADLKANQKQWTIVGMHRPMVCLRDITTPVVTRQQLLDLFVDNGVDLVIQAHEHVYEHTYPVGKNDTVYKNANSRTEDGTKYYVNPEGIMFVTCATGGSDGKAAVDGVDESFFETYAKGNKQSWGNFYIDGNKLSIGVYYYDSGVKSYSNNKFGIIKE